jgi:hypothetical protein
MKGSGNWNPDDWNSYHLSLAQSILFSKSLDSRLHEPIPPPIINVQRLGYSRSRNCKLPHDTIYSVLGLIDHQLRERIAVDYGQPIENLYCAVAMIFVESHKSLNILACSQHSPWQNTPSWAPDWNREARGNKFWAPATALHPEHIFFPKVTFEDEFSMTVEGFRVNRVAEILIEKQVYRNLVKESSTPRIGEKHHDPLATHWIFGKYADDMYTIAKDVFPGGDSVWQYPQDVFLQSLAIIIREKELGHENATRDLKENWKDEWDHSFDSWYSDCNAFFYGRTVVKTEKGFLGLGPDFSAKGDVVAILPGLNTPALLRPRDDEKKSYMWIGDVWIWEHMHGRAVDDFFAGIYHIENFRLT